MTDSSDYPKMPAPKGEVGWVQTDRTTHEEWARLSIKSPRAAALLHLLVARVGDKNAVVVAQGVLAKLLGVSRRTVIRALEDLAAGNWIEIRQVGELGTFNAYVLNDRVAWHGARDGLRWSLFSANVLVSSEDQPDRDTLGEQAPLRRLPRRGELQIPSGDGLPPPSEPALPGFELDLPATEPDEVSDLLGSFAKRLQVDPDTGEITE